MHNLINKLKHREKIYYSAADQYFENPLRYLIVIHV